MTSKRNYREALNYEFAFQEIKKESPLLLDDRIVLILGNIIERYSRSRKELAERVEMRREMPLSMCRIGSTVVVKDLSADDALSKRLYSMGLIKGVFVKVVSAEYNRSDDH
nr:FeoA domain-containing protein [uncultured Acetobacterium sp.]